MSAFNVVRFRVKPGFEQQFIDHHRKARAGFKGFENGWLVKTGDQTFCVVGQWKSFQSLVNARPQMIGILDEMRGMLEDLGGGLGVTDPVSGEAVVRFGPRKVAKKAAKKRPAKRKARRKGR
ncbi:MAG TPA: hypothetical protein VLV56_01810 [Burkholderiales bacterium]|nr:hypothetical protein [Burkholderiales bacterium]